MGHPLAPEAGFALPNKVVAVAIDRDNNSKYAVRWAITNLFTNKNKHTSIILIHVKKQKHQTGDMDGTAPDGHGESIDADTSQLFKAFRAYSSRKGVQAKEVVIVDNDVSKALLDYRDDNFITNIVFGPSTRNALQKQSRSHDVPTIINKSAPGFCSMYVISETKIQFVRPAVVPASLPDTQYHQTMPSHFPTEHSEPEEEVRKMVIREKQRSIRSERRRPKNRSANLSIDTIDTLFRG